MPTRKINSAKLGNAETLSSKLSETAASTSQGGQPATSMGVDVVVVDSVPTKESGEKNVPGHNTKNKAEAEVTAALDGPKQTIRI